MSHKLRDLDVSDVLKIVEDSACDETKQKSLKRMSLATFPKRILCDAERNEYLLSMPGEMREDFPRYYFFTEGYLFEIHRLSALSNEYSFIKFPKHLEGIRNLVQERFAYAAKLSGECQGWFEGKWDDLTDEQKALCSPVFVEDDVKPSLM
jgi:hypothetical protein